MLTVGAVVRLASRRLALIVSVALAPGVLVSVAWLVWLRLVPWSLQAIGTAVVLVMLVVWLLTPYTALWCVALLVSAYMRELALRMASLVMLAAGALLLDGSTASLAWAAQRVGGRGPCLHVPGHAPSRASRTGRMGAALGYGAGRHGADRPGRACSRHAGGQCSVTTSARDSQSAPHPSHHGL